MKYLIQLCDKENGSRTSEMLFDGIDAIKENLNKLVQAAPDAGDDYIIVLFTNEGDEEGVSVSRWPLMRISTFISHISKEVITND